MPSLLHEVLVELFRRHGELAPELLRRAAQVELEYARAELSASELTQLVPVEYRADAVIKLYDADGVLAAAVIVEVQLRRDDRKRFTWPLYIAALRERLRCPVHLLVVTTKPAVATWAHTPIVLGQPGFALQPSVMPLSELREIINLDAARWMPELAGLSTLRDDPWGKNDGISALISQRRTQQNVYFDPPSKRTEDPMIDLTAIDTDRMKRDLFELHIETTAWQGRLEALRTAVLALARIKLGTIDDEQQARIAKLFNEHDLHHLITALGTATNAEQARTELHRAIFLPHHPRYPR